MKSKNMPIDYCSQFAFQTIGWFLGSVVWTALRPEAMISTDPDLSGGLNNGLLSGDFAATNLGMAGGQVILINGGT